MSRNDRLQELCRGYLSLLRGVASRCGLDDWLDNTIKSNANNECAATEEEVELLSRAIGDDRLERGDVPKLMGKSYRNCLRTGVFDKAKKVKNKGIYSKVSVELLKTESE